MLSALTKDPNNHVKDTTAWTLGRIFEFLHGSTIDAPIITQANCQQIITVLLQSMKDAPNVAEKACGALYFLAQGYEVVGPSSPLTPYFQEIVQALLTVTHREDAGESRLRTAAYETLNEVKLSSDEERGKVNYKAFFVDVYRSATVHEEAMLAIGALAYATGLDFAKYMPEFYKALEDKILPYCDGIMTQLLKDLSSNQLHRSVKPPIFSSFGDIALAIGENFEKYLMYAMPMLQSAAELSAHTAGADDEMTEYTNSLRNGILEAYSGILQGDDLVMKTAIGVLGDLADTLGSNAGSLIQQSLSSKDFLNECLSSEDHMIKESAEWAKLAISRAISI
ncbi:hypothetical protein GH714_031449 [Hevea brasiliensis]|uniref:Importin subunit beta-1/Transportin-1-like TPR repeats domain-containing protein n=1 Tax=Hevea brasiliensis TaxID=3981 RepID=A0A6A6LG89_HEVBR|nr:hypothetical protein GH714_031449 [Hevea brasiliensis]